MDFVRKHWIYLTLGAVAVGSIGTAAWAYLAGDAIIEQLSELDRLRGEVEREGNGAQNASTIEAMKVKQAAVIAEQEAALAASLNAQKFNHYENRERQTLVPDVLPEPKSNGARIEFRDAYRAAFADLRRRLRARGPATSAEITRQQAMEDAKNQQSSSEDNLGPWLPKPAKPQDSDAVQPQQAERTIADILKAYPKAKAAEVVARSIYMYYDNLAFAPHAMLEYSETPPATDIWHAQMTLWIEQDFAYAISSLNEARAESLKKQNRAYDCWVAYMPIKRIKYLASEPWLGRGGGMNDLLKLPFAQSFTGHTNDSTKFIVPLQIRLIMEEAAIFDLLDAICRVGFYTPIQVEYRSVPANPLQDEYIYGNAPVIDVTIDIEGVFFRKVFDTWIPKDLAPILSRPKAEEELNQRR